MFPSTILRRFACGLSILSAILTFDSCHSNPGSSDAPVSSPPTYSDYFPLKLGNKWKYAYSDYQSSIQPWRNIKYEGVSDWEIVSVTPGLQRTDYSFEETVTGVRVETWVYPPSGPDTVRLTNAIFKFVVIDSANSPLRIEYYTDSAGYTTPNYYIGALVGELGVKRFLAATSPVDTSRYFGSDGRHVYLARSVGILEWGISHSTNSQRIILATLQSYQLK